MAVVTREEEDTPASCVFVDVPEDEKEAETVLDKCLFIAVASEALDEEAVPENCAFVDVPADETEAESVPDKLTPIDATSEEAGAGVVPEDCAFEVIPTLEIEEEAAVEDTVFARTQNTLVELDGPAVGDCAFVKVFVAENEGARAVLVITTLELAAWLLELCI
jgi:hypothetical protein